jgi:hypothetical protein
MKYALILLVLLASCGVHAPNSGGGGTFGPVKTFVKEDGTFLYFMGPLNFKSVTNKHNLDIDYSYNHKGSDIVVCNFTLKSPSLDTFDFEKFTLKSNAGELSTLSAELFFKEIKGKSFNYRYSVNVNAADWLAFMKAENQTVLINEIAFEPGKKYKKIMSAINNQVIFAIQ